jgi:UDP-N-acetylglucosamine transferase subunit ALG13
MQAPKKILVAPLDWGLGHASRCVPIIEALLEQDVEVFIGSNGRASHYLKAVFPALQHLPLPAYAVRYPSKNMIWNMAMQSVRLTRVARREFLEVQRYVQQYGIDAIISDNRFGCWSPQIYSVFITHQIALKLPWWLQCGNAINQKLIKQFDGCWLPDVEGGEGLAGSLVKPLEGTPISYIGTLSQISAIPTRPTLKYKIVALLSGPEPQRTKLEQELLTQIEQWGEPALIIRGKTEDYVQQKYCSNIEMISFLESQQLATALCEAEAIVCRPGYSSLMDLGVLQKRALLIPTPGQTEQIYLARRMAQLNYSPFQHQHELKLQEGVRRLAEYQGIPDFSRPLALKGAIDSLLAII